MAGGDRTTTPNDDDVQAFLDGVTDRRRAAEAREAVELIARVTGAEPRMWGSSIVGFGRQPYRTADGKDREWFAVGLSPRKASLTLYGLTFSGSHADVLERLGPHTTGKGCVYLKRLDAVDQVVLEELVGLAWAENHRAEEPVERR